MFVSCFSVNEHYANISKNFLFQIVCFLVCSLASIGLGALYPAYPAYYPYSSNYVGPIAIPVVKPDGYLADTPEVAAAKASHLAEVAKANGAVPVAYSGYVGQYAVPVVTPDGYLADTPEVAAAKAAHLAEVAKVKGAAVYAGYPYALPYYAGYPYAAAYSTPYVPVVKPDGYLADAPDVAAAKAAHLAEHAKAASRY